MDDPLRRFINALRTSFDPLNTLFERLIAIIVSIYMQIRSGEQINIRRTIIITISSVLVSTFVISLIRSALPGSAEAGMGETDGRTRQIEDMMTSIFYSPPDTTTEIGNATINSWQEGMALIRKNPREIGYYMVTLKYLEQEGDLKSAMTLIEMGLDYFDQPPPDLWKKLEYYRAARCATDGDNLRDSHRPERYDHG